MELNWHDIALVAAGTVGSATAVVHGLLTQRMMVHPVGALLAADPRASGIIQRLVPALLQFSTFNWFIGGLALISAAFWLEGDARLVTCALVASSYLFGAVFNLWATRGRHPGWMLMTGALVLIGVGATG